MNNVREVNRINERELELAVEGGASWHDDYKDSAYIFVGNLDKRLTEGDVIAIFSQYGELLDINLPRIPEGGLRDRGGDSNERGMPPSNEQQRQQQQQQQGGKPGDRRGFGFLLYDDQKSTILAVDNLNGFNLLGRTIRVDHVRDYKMPGAKQKEQEGEMVEPSRNAAPAMIQEPGGAGASDDEEGSMDLADPMASYIAASKREKSKGKEGKEDKEERRKRKEERKRKREERERAGAKRSRADSQERSADLGRIRSSDGWQRDERQRHGDDGERESRRRRGETAGWEGSHGRREGSSERIRRDERSAGESHHRRDDQPGGHRSRGDDDSYHSRRRSYYER